jgi:hypothetical protein
MLEREGGGEREREEREMGEREREVGKREEINARGWFLCGTVDGKKKNWKSK